LVIVRLQLIDRCHAYADHRGPRGSAHPIAVAIGCNERVFVGNPNRFRFGRLELGKERQPATTSVDSESADAIASNAPTLPASLSDAMSLEPQ
jgi:hypothetical protein